MRTKDVKSKVNAECTNVTKTRQFNHQKPLLKIAKKLRKKKEKRKAKAHPFSLPLPTHFVIAERPSGDLHR
jgi:hypothetical protein